MKELEIKTSSHSYTVTIGEDLRFHLEEYLIKDYSKIFVITDSAVKELYLDDVLKGLPNNNTFFFTIPNGERSKSIDMYYRLQTVLMEQHLDRDSVIIALGGGVVGDLAGFVAATFMRGIDYIQIPTTILSHDSSVGGKVAINHEMGKNMIGSFYPPKAVVYDVNTLHTLPQEEVRSGYAELIKEAFIANEQFLTDLLSMDLTRITDQVLIDHLYKGITVKADIVEKDEKEANIRKFLNFGHTLGHALETEFKYKAMTHGEAVAIGMLFALKLSQHTFNHNLYIEPYTKWLHSNCYPMNLAGIDPVKLIAHMKRDKKAHHNMLQFVLLKEIGQPVVVDMTEKEVMLALHDFIKELNAI